MTSGSTPPHAANHPGSSRTLTGYAVEVEELHPHFLRFDNVICHELQGNRPVMEYGLNFEHCTPFSTTSAF
jgi:hypothetical protein